MKRLALGLATASLMLALCQPALPQSGAKTDAVEQQHILMTLPEGKGRVKLAATRIDKDWATSVLHLQGNVRVEIWTTTKYPGHAMMVSADEVDYSELTGDISPRGNVRLTVQDAK